MKVRDVMVGGARSCSPHDDLARAAQLMWEHDCGSVPVVEDDDYVVGIITDRDVCMAAYTRGATLHAIRVGDVMSRQVRSVRPEEDAAAIVRCMRDVRVRRLPVVNALGRLVGIVSLGDLARRAAEGKSREIPLETVGEVLASIALPWAESAEPRAPLPDGREGRDERGGQDREVLRPQRAR